MSKDQAADFMLRCLSRGTSFDQMLTDNGGEFGLAYRKALAAHDIAALNSAPFSPKSHGRAEVAVRIIKRHIRMLLARLGLPLHFWPWAVMGAVEIYNKTCRPDGTSPWEDEFGEKPDRSHLPGDPLVFCDASNKDKVCVGAYMGMRHHASLNIMRCDPEDWDVVEIFNYAPARVQWVPIRNFECGLTYDAMRLRRPLVVKEANEPALLARRVNLSSMTVPKGYLKAQAKTAGEVRQQGLLMSKGSKAFLFHENVPGTGSCRAFPLVKKGTGWSLKEGSSATAITAAD